jgi:hypothetical protein
LAAATSCTRLFRALAGVDRAEDKLGLVIIGVRVQPERTRVLDGPFDEFPGGGRGHLPHREGRVHFPCDLAVVGEPTTDVGHGVFHAQAEPVNEEHTESD